MAMNTQPEIVTSIAAMQQRALALKRQGKRLGLVPTMGFLHDGHLSLMRRLRPRCDVLVVSIFVNPTQFGPNEDFERYPRDLAHDVAVCRDAETDIVFAPDHREIYPAHFHTYVNTEKLSEHLCGTFRAGHFRGVTTIVAKLFNIILPDIAIFGQKDAQQALILRRMVRDLNLPIEMVVGATVREADGLAMSSRNVYLEPEQRRQAPALYASLQKAAHLVTTGVCETDTIITAIRAHLAAAAPAARVQYVEIVETETLQPVMKIDAECLIALAVYFGATRLIDNIIVNSGGVVEGFWAGGPET